MRSVDAIRERLHDIKEAADSVQKEIGTLDMLVSEDLERYEQAHAWMLLMVIDDVHENPYYRKALRDVLCLLRNRPLEANRREHLLKKTPSLQDRGARQILRDLEWQ